MKTYINETLEIKGMSEDKYEMLIDFLEDTGIDFEETEYADYTIDERTEDEKYNDWLCAMGEIQYEEQKMKELERNV